MEITLSLRNYITGGPDPPRRLASTKPGSLPSPSGHHAHHMVEACRAQLLPDICETTGRQGRLYVCLPLTVRHRSQPDRKLDAGKYQSSSLGWFACQAPISAETVSDVSGSICSPQGRDYRGGGSVGICLSVSLPV